MSRKKKIILFSIIIVLVILFISIKGSFNHKVSTVYNVEKKDTFEIFVMSTGELKSEKFETIDVPGEELKRLEIWEISVANMIPEGTFVDSGDFVAELDQTKVSEKLMEVENKISDLASQLENAKVDQSLELSALKDEITNKEYEISDNEFALKQSMYESPAVIKQAENQLERTKREMEQLKKSQALKKRKINIQLQQITSQIVQQESRKQGILDLMNKLSVFSNGKGMIVYHTGPDGQKIESGSTMQLWREPTIAILPNFSSMSSNTYINEIDISRVKTGQKVIIGVDAFPDKYFPGKVSFVANMGEQVYGNDAKVFNVLINLDKSDPILKPGMTTSNKIITASYNNVIVVPIEAIHTSSGKSIVYKQKSFGIAEQEVKLGDFNENFIIIEDGLEEGEKIILSEVEEN